MKLFFKKHHSFFVMSVILFLLIIILIVFSILKNNSSFAEYWTRNFTRRYTALFGHINEKLPFSLTEASFVIVIVSCVVFLAWGFSLLGNKNYWGFIHRLLMVSLIIMGIITMYNVSVGLVYVRDELPLELYDGEIDKTKFKEIATYFVEDYNSCMNEIGIDEEGELILPYTKKEMFQRIVDEFDKLDDDYYFSYDATPKALNTSGLFTANGIVGMYFGVLGEVNYNTYSTNAELPFYVAHEICHSKGVMREDDAQLLAFYVLVTSEDPLLRYSAYWNTLDRLIALTSYTGVSTDRKEVINLICDEIWKNNQYVGEHWKNKTVLSDLADKINDWYLKTFGQKSGTSSYSDTSTETDDSGAVITLSKYQSLYFKIYYDNQE